MIFEVHNQLLVSSLDLDDTSFRVNRDDPQPRDGRIGVSFLYQPGIDWRLAFLFENE